MVAVVQGKPYARCEASNKKKCKDGASLLAWDQLINEEINQVIMCIFIRLIRKNR